MLEILTGAGLAVSAGLNAYIPLLVLGLAGRFIDGVSLPGGWTWLSNEWVLGVIAVLLVVEIIADKIPAVDSINDWLQSIVRPASGGIVFGGGALAETVAVSDPAAFVESGDWVPIAIGVGIALAVHLLKALVRVAANTLSAGAAAPALSTAEDITAVVLSLSALVLPLIVAVVLIALVVTVIVILRRARERRRSVPA